MATKSRSRSKSNVGSKSLSQHVVGTAAMGMPAPVKGIASSRWGSRIVLVGVAVLLASGVLSVTWDGNIPHLKMNRKRADEVRKEVRSEVEQFVPQQEHHLGDGHLLEHTPGLNKLPELGRKASSAPLFAPRSNPSR